MLTWRIYRTLDDPLKREPIVWRGYERLLSAFESPAQKLPATKFQMLRGSALLLLSSPFISMGLLAAFFPSPLLALLLSLIYGLLIVLRVSNRIASEHQRHTYELLCALPYGKMGVHWIYGVHSFQVSRMTRSVLRVGLMIGLLASPFLFGGWAYPITGQRAVQFWLVDTMSFCLFMLYDYFNMGVSATLIGMLVPAITRSHRTIRALSIGMFLLLQVATYLLAALLLLAVLPALLLRLNAPHLSWVMIAPITAAALIGFREAVTHWLWRMLERALQSTPMELDLLIR